MPKPNLSKTLHHIEGRGGGDGPTRLLVRVGIEKAGEGVSSGSGSSADRDGLEGAAQPAGTDQFSLKSSEDSQSKQGNNNGELECGEVVGDGACKAAKG